MTRAAGLALTASVLVTVGGFAWFVSQVAFVEISLERKADGIVALTGGASRVADAVELLGAGQGQRLLITGVNRQTRATEIAQLMPSYGRLFSCCVDLDYSAVNTVGNAIEARRWAKAHGFSSLIVVTSSYHMPRAMMELQARMPNVTLIAFPVVTEKLRKEPWWTSLPTARLLVSEYLKFVFAAVRTRLAPEADNTNVAGPSVHVRSPS